MTKTDQSIEEARRQSAPSPEAMLRLFERFLREEGLPVTPQREAIARTLFASGGHASVDDIEQALRDEGERIGKATIYRTLDLLVKSRLVEELDFGEGFKRYEHRLSREVGHAHLVCDSCGTVEEFHLPEMPAIEARVAREHGFRPARHRLALHGLCAECREAGVQLTAEGLTCPIEIA